MTTDSTMTDLERRVARALKLSRHLGHDDQQAARAALKAHAEWLEEQPCGTPGYRPSKK